jgi:hypothetical protein
MARLFIRPFKDEEWKTYPHVFLTSEMEWDQVWTISFVKMISDLMQFLTLAQIHQLICLMSLEIIASV